MTGKRYVNVYMKLCITLFWILNIIKQSEFKRTSRQNDCESMRWDIQSDPDTSNTDKIHILKR